MNINRDGSIDRVKKINSISMTLVAKTYIDELR